MSCKDSSLGLGGLPRWLSVARWGVLGGVVGRGWWGGDEEGEREAERRDPPGCKQASKWAFLLGRHFLIKL